MLEEYKTLVYTIKASSLSDDVRKKAVEQLIRLYSKHSKEDEKEALNYTKGAILHLFKNGRLRGMTEELKGLKHTYIQIMDLITQKDMDTVGLTPEDREHFEALKEKLHNELQFTVGSNEQVNEISVDGIEDDDVYMLKKK